MGSTHSHGNPETQAVPVTRRTRLVLAALLLPFVIATVVATLWLWPAERTRSNPDLGQPTELVDASLVTLEEGPCPGDPSGNVCNELRVEIDDGPEAGRLVVLSSPQGPGQPRFSRGDDLVLGRTVDETGLPTYYFSDFQRRSALLAFGALFAVLVVGVARWRGVGALIGLGVTGLVVTQFIIPAVLEGKSPVLVALTGSSVVVLLALYIAHGLNARTTVAVVGTLVSLLVVGVLAVVGTRLAHLTGLSSEETTYIQSFAGNVNIEGLLLGGMIIGGLGVLNDMTVSQASSVWEIHHAAPDRTARDLYRSGMRVGRDHIASTIYTLVLAYTGAALPLLILFTIADRSFADIASSELVGEEIVRTLVGSIGLIFSVPVTTALAAAVVRDQPTASPGPAA